MSHYTAVSDAMRMAEKQSSLIREVVRQRAVKAESQQRQQPRTPAEIRPRPETVAMSK